MRKIIKYVCQPINAILKSLIIIYKWQTEKLTRDRILKKIRLKNKSYHRKHISLSNKSKENHTKQIILN